MLRTLCIRTTNNINQNRGTTHILNLSDLNSKYCFIVEGEIDYMNIIDEYSFTSIRLGSTSNIRKIFDFDTSKTVLIITFNDIWSDCKDANIKTYVKPKRAFRTCDYS
ncbi:MAG: hypothetical protein NC177_12880 [Ruminococcus flavefaciens]|nr:hypothetical protein [Ruminococcus flavefaciens]